MKVAWDLGQYARAFKWFGIHKDKSTFHTNEPLDVPANASEVPWHEYMTFKVRLHAKLAQASNVGAYKVNTNHVNETDNEKNDNDPATITLATDSLKARWTLYIREPCLLVLINDLYNSLQAYKFKNELKRNTVQMLMTQFIVSYMYLQQTLSICIYLCL